MLFQFCYSVPDGFTNLDVQPDGPTNGEEYLQTTLSTGKRLLFASYQESTYIVTIRSQLISNIDPTNL